jgi:hypothetical protein
MKCSSQKHCHGWALHQMSAFHAYCSEWPYAVLLVCCNMLLTLLWSLEFYHQHSFHIWENRCHQFSGRQCLFWLSQLVSGCMYILCIDCSLVWTFTNETHASTVVAKVIWLRNSVPSLWHLSKKVIVKAVLCILCAPFSTFRTHLLQNLL